MYSITKSIDLDFAHIVSGHPSGCINVHGHTWKFEATIQAKILNRIGFVIDFTDLKRELMQMHQLLDHGMALGEDRVMETFSNWEAIGHKFLMTRSYPYSTAQDILTVAETQFVLPWMQGARGRTIGGMKFAIFPFNPSSERLAEWGYKWIKQMLREGPNKEEFEEREVTIKSFRVYETLHPVQAFAEYSE